MPNDNSDCNIKTVKGFEFPEDEAFFENLFSECGGLKGNWEHFDFRDPSTKRVEFNRIRNDVFKKLISQRGNICELQMHPECLGIAENIDHLIPLSSNKLNKELRSSIPEPGKKVPAQAFGSNEPMNFILACRKCNAFKKHKMPSTQLLLRLKFGK